MAQKIKYESLRKYNNYEYLNDETIILWTTNTHNPIYIDSEDFEKVKNYCWREDDHGYAKAHISKSDKQIKIHHIIIGKVENCVVDHIDRNPLNNKKENLRHVSPKRKLS